ncbi:MAG: hypothetical protein WCT01_01905 [Candidatus Shapirobacteria bacterium]
MVTKIESSQLTEKFKILLPAIGVGAVLGVVGLKLLTGTINQILEFKNNKVDWERQTADLSQKVKYFSSVNQDRLKQMEKVLNEAVFKQDKSYYLVGVIQKIASEYGFEVDSFQAQVGEIGKSEAVKKVESVNLGIKVVMYGPKDKYLELVTRLERTLPVLSINNFEIKSASDLVGIDMSVNAFFIPKQGEANVNQLSLNDLQMSEKELGLIGELEKYQKFGEDQSLGAERTYVPYDKTNPFIP